ncbi:YycH family regulatory protein [Bavariicoccus seileri]|uniref:YycH family regulatory protein n=1 Tax=Bavariicoccus seileri TaxID=549685 RepID=UPI003F913EAD
MIKKYVSTTILVVMVILSLALTVFIVWRPTSDVTNFETVPGSNVSSPRNNLSSEIIFSPVSVLKYNGIQPSRTQNKNLVAQANSMLVDQIDNVREDTEMDGKEFIDTDIFSGELQLEYDTETPLSFTSLVSDDTGENTDISIDRIVVPQEDSSEIYLVNTMQNKYYQADVTGDVIPDLFQLVDSGDVFPVQYFVLKNGPQYLPIEKTTLPEYTYLIEQEPVSFYIQELFDDTIDVRNRSSESVAQYNDSRSELKIDLNTNIMTFRKNQLNQSTTDTNVLRDALNIVRRLDSWSGIFRYSGTVSQSQSAFTFRRYLESYPVFGEPDNGLMQINMATGGPTFIQLSTKSIQIELDEEQNNVSLVSGEELTGLLQTSGLKMDQIENISIGYDWTTSEESSKVAKFTPKWFIKYNNVWRSLEDWQKSGGEG